ncbi:cyclic nucleotide-binding domain-containing protein [Flagellimonas sp. HMM57]|uniref:Crp/Fnr family transcriptional regulator n=1 Tax=unclassified Flagellimonas TaxID=2644544 RepID=UPI0013D8175C|nr:MULTISPECIES: cyclic nucleotide-binding domain-containing protein [unclassified Flagellimonas]UII74649.1 cyclic nucleotide-binding domain-containing protein [Flagellimonas sp. HMM57]
MNHYLTEKNLYQAFRSALEESAQINTESWTYIKPFLNLRHFKKGEFIIKEGEVENYLSAVASGCVRHFIMKGDDEVSFEFAFENELSNSYASFLSRQPSRIFIEAIEAVSLVSLHYDNLQELYKGSAIGERIGRLTTEGYYMWREQRELMLLTLTPEELYLDLLSQYPEYINRIPQKYLATYLQVKPESLSRIKRRIHTNRKRT